MTNWLVIIFLIVAVILSVYFLSQKCNQIYQNIEKKFNIDTKYVKVIRRLIPEFNGTIDISKIASYTVNKENIFLKIDPKGDFQTNLKIIFHEIAHCLVKEVGHGEFFQKKLQELLERARREGLLNDEDSSY